MSVILDAEINCDRNGKTLQIKAFGPRSKVLKSKNDRDQLVLSGVVSCDSAVIRIWIRIA